MPPAGAPDAGTRLGQDRATPASASASAPRTPLDLRLPVNGPISRQGSNSMLELMPHPPDSKTKLEKSLQDTARGDCRDEHAGAGLLGAVPVAVDTIRGKGCKW